MENKRLENPYLPKVIVGPYNRNIVIGSKFTSVPSLFHRRLGLGTAAGRLFPMRANLLGMSYEGVRIHTLITTDKQLMQYYDEIQASNSMTSFSIEGFNMIRVDWNSIEQKSQENKTRYDNNQKKNPMRGFVLD